MANLPTGTVTFLFTDIEGSTRLLAAMGSADYLTLSEEHFRIIREAVSRNDGLEVFTEGDAFFGVFTSQVAAVAAAVEAQRGLQVLNADDRPLWVRMGVHTGMGELGGDNYVGLDVNIASRVADAGNGGQVLVSARSAAGIGGCLPVGVRFEDLGIHELKDVGGQHLYQLRMDGLRTEFPPVRSLSPVEASLPPRLNTFIGRSEEIEEVSNLLVHRRLVTLLGPGGIGKTRLAVETARAVSGLFRDGAHFVDLAPVRDPDDVADAINKVLGLQTSSSELGAAEQLVAYLSSREMLLVLDNYEQIASETEMIASILDLAPSVRIIVTSRVPLHLHGEQEYPVQPLAVSALNGGPSQGAELFSARALEVDPGFRLTPESSSAVATLVQRLDGLPLAIELAASRVRLLSPSAILERLDNRLLANRSSAQPSRQQTIENTIEWSYELLNEEQRALLRRLSVFVGGADLSEIERLLEDDYTDSLDLLEDIGLLVDHSLVRRMPGDALRYRMLQVIREYAWKHLVDTGEADWYRQRHALIYSKLVERARPHLLDSTRATWLERLDTDHENIKAALDTAVESGDVDMALTMSAGMWRFWHTRGPLPEAISQIQRALALDGGDPMARAAALEAAGGIAYWQGDFVAMERYYQVCLRILEGLEPSIELSNAYYNLSFAAAADGDTERAEGLIDKSAELAETLSYQLGIARSEWARFDTFWYAGDPEASLEYAERSLAHFEELNDRGFDYGWACYAVADSLIKVGRYEEGLRLLDRVIGDFLVAGDLSALVLFFNQYAGAAYLQGQPKRAARIFGAAQALMERTGARLSTSAEWSEQTRQSWGELIGLGETEREAVVEGRHWSPDRAVSYAMEWK